MEPDSTAWGYCAQSKCKKKVSILLGTGWIWMDTLLTHHELHEEKEVKAYPWGRLGTQ